MPATLNSDNLAATVASVSAVLYTEQTLSDSQQGQARENVGIDDDQIRKITISTSVPSGGSDGDIWVIPGDPEEDTSVLYTAQALTDAQKEQARTNIGVLKPKTLWSGTWSSGDITVDGLSDYSLFAISPSGQGTNVIASLEGGEFLRGIGGFSNASGSDYIFSFAATVSGNTLTFVKFKRYGASTTYSVDRIDGIA